MDNKYRKKELNCELWVRKRTKISDSGERNKNKTKTKQKKQKKTNVQEKQRKQECTTNTQYIYTKVLELYYSNRKLFNNIKYKNKQLNSRA